MTTEAMSDEGGRDPLTEAESAEVGTLAAEWLFYAARFGIVAEVSNGRYTDEQCKLIASAVKRLQHHIRILQRQDGDQSDRLARVGHERDLLRAEVANHTAHTARIASIESAANELATAVEVEQAHAREYEQQLVAAGERERALRLQVAGLEERCERLTAANTRLGEQYAIAAGMAEHMTGVATRANERAEELTRQLDAACRRLDALEVAP